MIFPTHGPGLLVCTIDVVTGLETQKRHYPQFYKSIVLQIRVLQIQSMFLQIQSSPPFTICPAWCPYHILLLLCIERLLDYQTLGHKFSQKTQNNRTKPLVCVLCPNLLRDSSDNAITAQLTKVSKHSTGSMVV